MELEEAIKNVKKFNEQNKFRDGGVLNQSIDTVLKELDNRIPVKKVENKIEEYRNLCHEEKNDLLRSHYYHRYASLEELLYKE